MGKIEGDEGQKNRNVEPIIRREVAFDLAAQRVLGEALVVHVRPHLRYPGTDLRGIAALGGVPQTVDATLRKVELSSDGPEASYMSAKYYEQVISRTIATRERVRRSFPVTRTIIDSTTGERTEADPNEDIDKLRQLRRSLGDALDNFAERALPGEEQRRLADALVQVIFTPARERKKIYYQLANDRTRERAVETLYARYQRSIISP